jgi:hypothetical protein
VSAVLVGQAFQSVQFIAQDYLGTVPEGVLVECVRMTAAYAAQPVDMNTSLTAIGLLWNMADFFGRTITGQSLSAAEPAPNLSLNFSPNVSPTLTGLLRASDGNTAEGGGDPSGSAVGAAAARAATGGEKKAALIAEVLLLPLFTSLQKLCSDPRPEVNVCVYVCPSARAPASGTQVYLQILSSKIARSAFNDIIRIGTSMRRLSPPLPPPCRQQRVLPCDAVAAA